MKYIAVCSSCRLSELKSSNRSQVQAFVDKHNKDLHEGNIFAYVQEIIE